MELYKKYRPKDFDSFFGNESVVSSIKSKLENGNLPHFLIFAGPPGCGKTTLSRILKEKLGVRDLDFNEINAADNNGVEVGRAVSSSCLHKPLGKGKNRLWLFDEAHRLTAACCASMLKTLEDGPEHAHFHFATSEVQKLPEAILSRGTIYTLKPLSDSKMMELLHLICEKEGIEIPEKALEKIVEFSCGQSRNALVSLDNIKDLKKAEMADAVEKTASLENQSFNLLKSLMWSDGSWSTIAKVLQVFEEDPEQTRRYLMTFSCNRLKDVSKSKDHEKCFQLAYSMKKPFYDNGMNDLVFACRDFYDEVYGK